MDRRLFLSLLTQATSGLVIAASIPEAVEKAADAVGLSVPGELLDPLPRPLLLGSTRLYAASLDEINALTVKHILPGLADYFFRNDPFLTFLKRDELALAT